MHGSKRVEYCIFPKFGTGNAATAIGVAVGTAATGEATEPTVTDPLQRARKYRLRPTTRDRIKVGHEAVLAELKPTRAQRERGVALRRCHP